MKKALKMTAAALSLALTCSCITPVFAENAAAAKDENVFIILNSDGTVKSQTVSDWLHSDGGFHAFCDVSRLEGITNLKGEETPQTNGSSLVWTSDNSDIYYQGTTEQTPPVTANIVYSLDGAVMTAEQAQGKSGHLRITIDLKNNETHQVELDGTTYRVATPFATVVGANLPVATFKNIVAEHGTVQTDSSNQIVGFVCLPGLSDTFDGLLTGSLSDLQQYLLDTVVIEADVENFAAPTLMFACATDAGKLTDLGEMGDFGDVSALMNQLTDAVTQLTEGAAALYSGAVQLDSGAQTLTSGASELKTGAATAKDGAAQLNAGLATLVSNNDTLNSGASQIVAGVFSSATTQLRAQLLRGGVDEATVNGITLVPENYTAVLAGLAGLSPNETQITEAETTIRGLLAQKGINDATGAPYQSAAMILGQDLMAAQQAATTTDAVIAGATMLGKAQTVQAVQAGLLSGDIPVPDNTLIAVVAQALGLSMDDPTQASQATLIAALAVQLDNGAGAPQAQITAAADLAQTAAVVTATLAAMQTPETQDAAYAKIRTLCTTAVTEQLLAASSELGALKKTLDDVLAFQAGLTQYTAGVATAASGAAALASGNAKLYDGIAQLQDGTATLKNGTATLKDGAQQLNNGLTKFDNEAVGKLAENSALGNLGTMQQLVTEMKTQAENYRSYTGAPSGISASVKFVMKTEPSPQTPANEKSGADNSAAQAVPATAKTSFWQRLKNLFVK